MSGKEIILLSGDACDWKTWRLNVICFTWRPKSNWSRCPQNLILNFSRFVSNIMRENIRKITFDYQHKLGYLCCSIFYTGCFYNFILRGRRKGKFLPFQLILFVGARILAVCWYLCSKMVKPRASLNGKCNLVTILVVLKGGPLTF